MTRTDHKIDDLQHLRGLSILLILAVHLSLASELLGLLPYKVSNSGWLGVEVFFVVSGYVITAALHRDRYEPLSFFVKRVFRLTPALLVFAVLSAGVVALFLYTPTPQYARHIFLADISREEQVVKGGLDAGLSRPEADRIAHGQATFGAAVGPLKSWDELQAEWAGAAMRAGVPPAEAEEKAATARATAEGRWQKRVLRDFTHQTAAAAGGYFTIRNALFEKPVFYTNAAMWSLSVEDQFYALLGVGCLVAAVALRRAAPRVVPWAIVGAAATLYTLAAVIRFDFAFEGNYWWYQHEPFYAQMWQAAGTGPAWAGPSDARRVIGRVMQYLLTQRFDFLALGVLCGHFDRRFRPWVAARLGDRGPFLAVGLFFLPLALGAVVGKGDGPFQAGWLLLVAGWCYAALTLIAAHNRMLPAARGPSAAVLRYFGDRSYTIYLLHIPAVAMGWYLLRTLPDWYDQNVWGVNPHGRQFATPMWEWLLAPGKCRYGWVQMLVVLAVLLPVTEVVYRLVELPLTRVGRRLAGRVRIIPPDHAGQPASPPLRLVA